MHGFYVHFIQAMVVQDLFKWTTPEDVPYYMVGAELPRDLKTWEVITAHVFSAYRAREWVLRYENKFGTGAINRLASRICDEVKLMKQNGIFVLTFGDHRYPPLLRQIPDPPIAIFVKGQVGTLSRPSLAVVGARRASTEALKLSYQLGQVCREGDLNAVSGGALGCDISFHRGVTSAGGYKCCPIVVFAGGLNEYYPRANLATFRVIEKRGGILMSEKCFNAQAKPLDFPIRNRIVAGLSQLSVLVQASTKSGAMITAHRALDYGRSVMVFKPSHGVTEPYAGNFRLIEQGAPSFEKVEELLL